jgi:hypothetical protein
MVQIYMLSIRKKKMASNTYSTQPHPSSIRTLPSQYWRIISKPSVQTFSAAQENASWGSIWLQLIVVGVVSAALYALYLTIVPPQTSAVQGLSASTIQNITIISTVISLIVFTPISFFISAGVLYGVARLLKGDGTYLKQLYTLTLIGVPMVLLSSLLLLIPATSSWLPYLPHIYSLILVVLAIRAVHHLSTGKAIAVIILPAVIVLALVLIVTILLLSLIKH